MAEGDGGFSTESDDSEGASDHTPVAKHPSSEQPDERRDSDSEEDAQSHLGKDRASRVRKDWQTVEVWNREVYEDDHIQNCIIGHAQQFMRVAGLSFIAGLKKKESMLDCWVRRSKKSDKEGTTTVTIMFYILRIHHSP